MLAPYLGEIRLFGFGIVPRGWASCNGSLLSIAQNQALFSILGTTYGGNGTTTFALPNLSGRAPVHAGSRSNVKLGERGGEEAHTLTTNEMPVHTHIAQANSGPGTTHTSTNNVWANSGVANVYSAKNNSTMNPNALSKSGGSQGHANMQPYTVLNYCIAVNGNFPTRN